MSWDSDISGQRGYNHGFPWKQLFGQERAHKYKSLTVIGQSWSNVSDCAVPEGSDGCETGVYLFK